MEDDSTNMYLQAGLKFLEAAHHQEAANDRPGDFSTSFRIYLDTAYLCEYVLFESLDSPVQIV